jgi:hypothetical protein
MKLEFLAKHTAIKVDVPAYTQFLKEQQWLTRYRGPFATAAEAATYIEPFIAKYGDVIKFTTCQLSVATQLTIPSAIFNPIPFRDPKTFSHGLNPDRAGWAQGLTFRD